MYTALRQITSVSAKHLLIPQLRILNMNTQDKDHKPDKPKTYTVIVNGRKREVTDHKLTYLQVVQLAYPGEQPTENIVFTVTYSHPTGRDGSLVAGQEVTIKDGMIFNVKKTDRS
jgi:hypothetical protein